MNKKGKHKQDLIKLFDEFFEIGNEEKIMEYIISNSNLPGPRANLELAEAFSDAVEQYSKKEPERTWNLCIKMSEISADEAETNNPNEFLTFCGVYAVGAFASVCPVFFQKAINNLRKSADDPRWRTREAAAKGIQRLIEKQSNDMLKELESWIVKDNWFAMRAAAAGAAEPSLLRNKKTARQALELHKKIFAQLIAAKERKSEEFKTLKKGLAYTLSVVVYAIPKEGFEYINQLIDSHDPDALWIVKENLKKNRLIKNFPGEVEKAKKLLKWLQ